MTVTIAEARLRDIGAAIFAAGGSAPDEARMCADHLVDANMKGHDSHGIGMVPAYVGHLHAGLVRPNTPAACVRDDGALLQFDGRLGYGRRAAGEATAAAIARCRETGVVVCTLRNSHHVGRVGKFAEMAADAGFVSVHFVNACDHRPLVAPHRGTDPRLLTNPFCVGVPAGHDTEPTILDMATSTVALGKTRVAYNAGRAMDDGLLIDHAGRPTTDPAVMWEEPYGAIRPFAAHKGYALALVCELLAGGLGGGGTIQPGNPRANGIVNNMFSLVVDPARLVDLDWLGREIDATIAYCKASPPADPDLPVLVPGEPERRARADRAAAGIALADAAWAGVCAAALSLGIARAELADAASPG